MTVRALQMSKIGSRTARSDCVARAITFATSGDYGEIVDTIRREQSQFNPERERAGVYTGRLLKTERRMSGHMFKKILFAPHFLVGLFRREYSTGTFLVCTYRHAFVIKDGEVWDALDTSDREIIREAWVVEKI
jgi:hypothetical protein